MAVSEKIRNRAETAIQAIRRSRLSAGDQDDLIEIVCDARDSTNDLSDAEKLQSNANNIFALVFLFVRAATARQDVESWKQVVIECRREIALIALGVITLLVLRPQIADVVEHILARP